MWGGVVCYPRHDSFCEITASKRGGRTAGNDGRRESCQSELVFLRRRSSGPFPFPCFENVTRWIRKCHWFDIWVLINKPRRRSWGIVGSRGGQTAKGHMCLCFPPSLSTHEDHVFVFSLDVVRLWLGWTDPLDKDTSATPTKHCGWKNEPWRTDVLFFLFLLCCFCMFSILDTRTF